MNRPETGPMQFPGELMPGFYITYEDLVRIANYNTDANSIVLAARNGITPPQRAELKD